MSSPLTDAALLFDEIRSISSRVTPGLRPWRSQALLRLVNETRFGDGSQAEALQRFALRLVYLLDSPSDGRSVLLRRLIRHNLLSESRVIADSDQRDHLLHVTQVYLLGWVLLHRCRVFFEPPTDWKPYDWPSEVLFDRLNEAWLVTALLHDCGYSVEFASGAGRHEARVRGAFGEAYQAGAPGEADPEALEPLARSLWETRCSSTGRPVDQLDVADVAARWKGQATRPDHGLASAFAVLREAKQWCPQSEVIPVAARSIASHNFQYYVRPELPIDHPTNRFFSLSFRTEPVAALLHLCDELQEWSREREDERLAFSLGTRGRGFLATYLTGLKVPDPSQLAIEVARRRELHPEDRSVQRESRLRLEQERRLAEATRRFSRLFPSSEDPQFRLRLRVRESVGGGQCRVEFRANYPISGSIVAELDAEWRASKPKAPDLFESVSVKAASGARLEATESTASLQDGVQPLRLALVLPGGRGKSTLLRQLALVRVTGYRVYYLEQLPSELVDLRGDLERLVCLAPSRPLVLFDHLDRLVNEDSLAFWQDQLASLSGVAADVVLACRPEEFDRFFRARLGPPHYEIIRQEEWRSSSLGISLRLTDGLYPAAEDLEQSLRGYRLHHLGPALGSFALSVGSDRRIQTEVDPEWLSERAVAVRGMPVIVRNREGSLSFIHDCVQDLFAAGKLSEWLLGRKSGIGTTIADQPHDVFRMLVELLTREADGLFGSREGSQSARFHLALALGEESTIQQWLYDTRRLHLSATALQRWATFDDDRPWSRSTARKLAGHAAYARGSLPRLRDARTRAEHLQHFRTAVRLWARSAADAEEALAAKEVSGAQFAWQVAFLADHLLLALTRIASLPELVDEAREAADEAVSHLRAKTPEPVGPGWIRDLLRRFSVSRSSRDIDATFESICDTLESVRRPSPSSSYDSLDVRRAHVTCHMGLLYIDHAFVPGSPGRIPPTDPERLERAEYWYEQSISYRETVLLAMESADRTGVGIEGERFATAAAGASDAAHQYRGVFETLLLSSRSRSWCRADLLVASDAYSRMKAAWGRAENLLGPTERLGNMYSESVLHLGIGEAIEWLVGRPTLADHKGLEDEVRTKILRALEPLAQRLPYVAESSSRYVAADMTPERILARFSGVPDLPRRLAEALNRE